MDKKLKATKKRRVLRVRKKIKKNSNRIRLQVHKSNRNFYAQLIDDDKNIVIAGASTINIKEENPLEILGKKIVDAANKKDIKKVVFDRSGFKYHGTVAKFASAVRNYGLEL